MKRKFLLLPLLLTLLVSCADGLSSSNPESSQPGTSQNPGTSDVTSDPSTSEIDGTSGTSTQPSTSTPGTSEIPPSSEVPPSSEETPVYTNIQEIRTLAYTLQSQVNASNIATSTYQVKVRAQLLSLHDYVAGGNDYTYRNKALVANGDGYILVSFSAYHYDLIKAYLKDQQVYDFTGTISLYNGEPEITVDGSIRPQYLSGVTLSYTLDVIDGVAIKSIFDNALKTMKVNNKGIGHVIRPMTLAMKYVTKMENSIGLFTDGINVVQVYGHDKLNNNFSVGGVYDITFVPGFYYYKTTFTYIAHKTSSAVINDVTTTTSMTASQLYGFNYVLEPKFAQDIAKNLLYAELFINAYSFVGFANYYVKDNQYNICFDDVAKDAYNAYTNARDAKSLFINNDSGLKLYYPNDFLNCIFWDEASLVKADKSAYTMTFIPYLLNTNKYFQIQVLEETYQLAL